MIRISIALTALLAGCTTPEKDKVDPLAGGWGGAHVGLVIDAEGGKLDYDCAAGTIDHPPVLNAMGEFHERGTHTPGTGGPVRQDYVQPSLPAVYEGSVQGEHMTLRVIVPSNGTVIGPLELRKGAAPILTRCL
jgi:hypothetical protein